MIKSGDIVEVVGFNGINSERIGQKAKVLRPSFNGLWIRFEDGTENVWRRKLLKKYEGENGTRTSAGKQHSINGDSKIEVERGQAVRV